MISLRWRRIGCQAMIIIQLGEILDAIYWPEQTVELLGAAH